MRLRVGLERCEEQARFPRPHSAESLSPAHPSPKPASSAGTTFPRLALLCRKPACFKVKYRCCPSPNRPARHDLYELPRTAATCI